MSTALLSDNDRKAELSFAYLWSLAAFAGFICQRGPDPDRDSVDAIVRAGGSMRPQIDVQLKATSSSRRLGDGLHFQLRRKNYDDLRASRMCPIILVVLELPENASDWLHCDTESLVMRRCAWWASIEGSSEIDGDSKTIVLPESQSLNPDAMKTLMDQARQGKLSRSVTP